MRGGRGATATGIMRILVSNDDGYRAPGIIALSAGMRELGEVRVVAPDRDRSGASNSLTLDRPLYAEDHGNGVSSVEGTPTDCVHLAITGLLDEEPDMVVSGINSGPNMGDDVLYSGTVAAATEGRFLGLPALAISFANRSTENLPTAVRVAQKLVLQLKENPLPSDSILNVNVPDLPWDQLAGFQVTRLGHRHRAEPVVKDVDPRGRTMYWVGPAGGAQDAGPGTDFYALEHGFVSVTPLQTDATRHSAIESVGLWLQAL